MATVHHIKSARKADPKFGIEVGDSYYKWSLMTGPRTSQTYKSKTPPKPSQLTSSPFKKALYEMRELVDGLSSGNFETAEDLASVVDEIVGDLEALCDEQQSSLENMPEGLQAGHTGQLLQERIDGLTDWVSELQSLDLSWEYDKEEPNADTPEHEKWDTEKKEAEKNFIEESINEIQNTDGYSE